MSFRLRKKKSLRKNQQVWSDKMFPLDNRNETSAVQVKKALPWFRLSHTTSVKLDQIVALAPGFETNRKELNPIAHSGSIGTKIYRHSQQTVTMSG